MITTTLAAAGDQGPFPRRYESRWTMSQGRKPADDAPDDGTLFEPSKEQSGLIAERTPPLGVSPSDSLETDAYPTGYRANTPTPPMDPSLLPGSTDSLEAFDPVSAGVLGVGTEGQATLKKGQVLFDRYIVERLIGEGGMGTVWLVKDREFDSERALKLIISGIANDPQARARFRREARILDRLNHPNAVRVYDARVGREMAFIAMEYVRGESLNKILVPGMPVPLDVVTSLMEQLCDVLQAANDEGIIHRDLKPNNLMLVEGRDGKKILKLLDFGIAKIREGADDVHTMTGNLLGTPLYMSPEQITGDPVDARSDLYSAGVILYEMLTGHRPFSGAVGQIIYSHTSVAPPAFADVNPKAKVPPNVEQVVRKCLSKKPADRPQTPRELKDLFVQAVVESGTFPDLAPTGAHKPGHTLTEVEQTQGKLRGVLAVSVLVLAAVLIALLVPRPWPDGTTVTNDTTKQPLKRNARTLKKTELAGQDAAWKQRGFQRDKDAKWTTSGWPDALVGPEHVRFLLTAPDGIYLPEGYDASEKVDPEDQYPRTITRKADGTTFVRIAGGEFTMGNYAKPDAADEDDSTPAHKVKLSGFYLQTTEVTNDEISHAQAICDEPGCKEWRDKFEAKSSKIEKSAVDYPAVGISQTIAAKYARLQGGQLPTEAQWEFAARSRGKEIKEVPQFKGNQSPLDRYANTENMVGIGSTAVRNFPGDVRNFPGDVTEQGIFDMAGNVREWCRDYYQRYKKTDQPVRDPEVRTAPVVPAPPGASPEDSGPTVVVRGGSFTTYGETKDTFRRGMQSPSEEIVDLGFRIVIECPEGPRDPR
jgi:serine/threonine-protein kinase